MHLDLCEDKWCLHNAFETHAAGSGQRSMCTGFVNVHVRFLTMLVFGVHRLPCLSYPASILIPYTARASRNVPETWMGGSGAARRFASLAGSESAIHEVCEANNKWA
ncbi:hypothetical protein J7T55_000130 [Diaporthe amygdali]|uniref:uncharacterized protein n=1 Tax=Phomopsis amygdali TaxID=1214568 RepID=UPI0022FDE9AB|nr:uncharacterized protein J7T55_000130 [Diaporthe amygdali]KAJ0108165.1 hypothetical protein J7T55_000130 [Diaporthe amygdali]